MKFTPTEAEKKKMIERQSEPGFSTYEICPLCGLAQFRSRDPNKETDVAVILGTAACPRCEEVQRRAPEVFGWVISVIKWKERLNNDEAKAP